MLCVWGAGFLQGACLARRGVGFMTPRFLSRRALKFRGMSAATVAGVFGRFFFRFVCSCRACVLGFVLSQALIASKFKSWVWRRRARDRGETPD